jgi:hypothetical protein
MALYGQYMSTTSKVTHYVLAFWRLPKGIGKDMEPMESMPPPQSDTMTSLLLSTFFYSNPI